MDLVYNIILPEIRLNYNSRWAVDILQTGNFLISISVCEEMWYSTFFGYLVPRTLNLQFYKSQSSLKFHCDTASIDWTSFLEIVFFLVSVYAPHTLLKLRKMLFGGPNVTQNSIIFHCWCPWNSQTRQFAMPLRPLAV